MQQTILGVLAGLVAVLTAFLGFSDKTVNEVVDNIAGRTSQALGGVSNLDILRLNSMLIGKTGTSTPGYDNAYFYTQSIKVPSGNDEAYWCNEHAGNVVISNVRWVYGKTPTSTMGVYVTAGTSTPASLADYTVPNSRTTLFHTTIATSSAPTDFNGFQFTGAPNASSGTSSPAAVLRFNSCVSVKHFTRANHLNEDQCNPVTGVTGTSGKCAPATSTTMFIDSKVFFDVSATTSPVTVN